MRALPVLLVFVLLAGCIDAPTDEDEPADGASGPGHAFGVPVLATPEGAGSEPSILVTRDGTIYIASVLGSAEARGDGLWRSEDGGMTWKSLGKPDYPFGGGDADLDEDDAGTLYLTGQWRGAALPVYVAWWESVAVSKDRGETWTVNPVASVGAWVDRQWLATQGTGTVYMAFNHMPTGLMVSKSTDSGATWAEAASTGLSDGIAGDILVDPKDGMLLIPYGPGIGGGSSEHRLVLSPDGKTFTPKTIRAAPAGRQAGAIFGALEMDAEGRLYYAWSEQAEDEGMTVYVVHSEDRGDSWSEPAQASLSDQTAVFPWIVVGDVGRVGVTYYAAEGRFKSDDAPADALWYPMATVFDDLLAAPDGTAVVRMAERPNHQGPLCTGGTGCDAQYRRLGDFFESDLTPDGRIVSVWVDDTQGADKPQLDWFSWQRLGSLERVE